ncbi:MAG: chemotaxis protein CheB [Gammaproteobacteria bacterium]|nr:chemotaxis protein CheB [Gammaproteobacteria bacterium]MCP5135659.1 chemotaxis protein CheB [Gammaproteobacteria bacterium]
MNREDNPDQLQEKSVIRVMLVDDSLLTLTVLKRGLAGFADIQIVATERDARAAFEAIPAVRPDVICTDLNMPGMDGLAFVKAVMANYPTPILVISVSVFPEDKHNVFSLLKAGAVDVYPKPKGGLSSNNQALFVSLARRIRVIAGVKVFGRSMIRSYSRQAPLRSGQPDQTPTELVAIRASTGGPMALYELFSRLPGQFPVPVVFVQHIAPGFGAGLIRWLDHDMALSVTVAEDGDQPVPGKIYCAPDNKHLILDRQGRLKVLDTPAVNGHRPSITLFFESVAEVLGNKAIGVLLTGMGDDGALGLRAMHDRGALCFAQDEASSAIYGMPKVAVEIGAVDHQGSPVEIADALVARIDQAAETA